MNLDDIRAMSALHREAREIVCRLDRLSQIPPDTGDIPAHEAHRRLAEDIDTLQHELAHVTELYQRRMAITWRTRGSKQEMRHIRHAPHRYVTKPLESSDLEDSRVVRFDMNGQRGTSDVPETSGVWKNRQREGRSTRAR